MKHFFLTIFILLVFTATLNAQTNKIQIIENGQVILEKVYQCNTPGPPPGPTPTPEPPPVQTDYSAQVAGAYRADTRNNYGDFAYMGCRIPMNTVTYFLIDPKATGVQPKNLPYMLVAIEDMNFALTAQMKYRILELDASNKLLNVIADYPPGYGSGGMVTVTIRNFTATKFAAGGKFLVEATETGKGSTSMNVKWH